VVCYRLGANRRRNEKFQVASKGTKLQFLSSSEILETFDYRYKLEYACPVGNQRYDELQAAGPCEPGKVIDVGYPLGVFFWFLLLIILAHRSMSCFAVHMYGIVQTHVLTHSPHILLTLQYYILLLFKKNKTCIDHLRLNLNQSIEIAELRCASPLSSRRLPFFHTHSNRKVTSVCYPCLCCVSTLYYWIYIN
jgi:hypothetical protein